MTLRCALAGLTVFLCLGASPVLADGTQAARSFEIGKILLRQGDFDGAVQAFKLAAELDASNDRYFTECAVLQRIMKIRADLKGEQDAETWRRMAAAVYDYLRLNDVDTEALKVARMMYEKSPDADTTARLADALLDLDQSAEALEICAKLPADQQSVETRIGYGIALARVDRVEEAKAIAATIELPKDCGPRICYDAARLYARVGDKERAIDMLRCSFECTPPDGLRDAVVAAKACSDFAALVPTPEFRTVSETQSKVSAGCGSKAGCGGCPKSKACSKPGEDAGSAGKEAGQNAPQAGHCPDDDKK